ncbi:HPF/RaiA family ribosome-associated protein [Pedobacter insulae]|uniref:Sigma 54 modulation protein / S30EA ribosomal protein n=1 Tax=Pedobacter insulae TaxID=414048 RepID=A0A1I3AF38_9SPHI|nr:HPF/RaiA family ribosome-associated protein [Pedobacter insulae]SFH48722.1 Sigma 54 modulation protein / S30EA ribosomal protein [Pedobacter insulae]
MIIQLNADKNLTIHAEYESQLTEKINKELSRFTDNLSRLEVHLSDENGNKTGQDDKKCVLEARIEGRQPVVVSTFGQTYDVAMNSALDKLKNALSTIDGKIKAHH